MNNNYNLATQLSNDITNMSDEHNKDLNASAAKKPSLVQEDTHITPAAPAEPKPLVDRAGDTLAAGAAAISNTVTKAKDATVAKATEIKEATFGKSEEPTVAEKAASVKDEAVDKAVEAKDATVDKATEIKDATVEKATDAKDATVEKAAEVKDATAEKAAAVKEATVEKAASVKEAVAEKTSDAADATAAKAEEVKQKAEETKTAPPKKEKSIFSSIKSNASKVKHALFGEHHDNETPSVTVPSAQGSDKK